MQELTPSEEKRNELLAVYLACSARDAGGVRVRGSEGPLFPRELTILFTDSVGVQRLHAVQVMRNLRCGCSKPGPARCSVGANDFLCVHCSHCRLRLLDIKIGQKTAQATSCRLPAWRASCFMVVRLAGKESPGPLRCVKVSWPGAQGLTFPCDLPRQEGSVTRAVLIEIHARHNASLKPRACPSHLWAAALNACDLSSAYACLWTRCIGDIRQVQ